MKLLYNKEGFEAARSLRCCEKSVNKNIDFNQGLFNHFEAVKVNDIDNAI